MLGINSLIRSIYESGLSKPLSDGILLANFVIQLLFLLKHRHRYGITVKQVLGIELIVYPASLLTMYILAWLENGSWGGFNIVRIFVYVPLYALLTQKMIGVPFGKFVDFIAPSIVLNKVVGHIACPFTGCCHGYPCSWGIWNPGTNTNLFPNQWLECVVSLGILLFLLRYAKKQQYRGTGAVYATMLCMYGPARFLMEFLRDNHKLVAGISNLAFHALFMAVVGTIWIFVLVEKERENKRKADPVQRKRRK